MPTMLLSIKPEYAKAILDGQKEYEFRKRRCKTGVNKIILYSTAPESKVVGEAEIEDIIEGSPSKIWEMTKKAAGITQAKYHTYYQGYHNAVAYKLKNVVVYDPPKELSDYGIEHVPQSFQYIDTAEHLKNED